MTVRRGCAFVAAWLVACLTLAGCTGTAAESAWEVVDSAHDPMWVLSIGSPKAQWAAGDAIDVQSVLAYVGPGQGTEYFGPGSGILAFGLREIGGTRHLDGLTEGDCSRHAIRTDEPLVSEFKKGGYSADDPNAAFYEQLLADPRLRLPSGEWELTVRAAFSMPPDCVEGRVVSLVASIVPAVE
jgi:hypothetical protein